MYFEVFAIYANRFLLVIAQFMTPWSSQYIHNLFDRDSWPLVKKIFIYLMRLKQKDVSLLPCLYSKAKSWMLHGDEIYSEYKVF